MQLKAFSSIFPLARILPKYQELQIAHLSDSSKNIVPNTMFFAIKGPSVNGHEFIGEAIKAGASVIVYEQNQPIDLARFKNGDICFIAVHDIRDCLAKAAAIFWPDQPKNIVAVTGTSGKTSVAYFTNQLWQMLDYKSSFIGTLGVSALPDIAKNLTTPGVLALSQILSELKNKNIENVVIEASSHGIEQARLNAVKLSAAAFTNFGRDHLDYHQNSENYFVAKMKLFTKLLPKEQPALIFADDAYSEQVLSHLEGRKVLTVGQKGEFIKIIEKKGANFTLKIEGQLYKGSFLLPGLFQWHNALMALALVVSTGGDVRQTVENLSKLSSVPGRLQLVGQTKHGADVYVDYAHKPEALETILQTLLKIRKSKLILVFGCGGNRDRGKRPLMGAIAEKLADIVMVTDDNPRYEDASFIRKEILQATPKAIEIDDRGEAIKYALSQGQQDDIILIAGKGPELGQQIGDRIEEFSDEQEVLKYIGMH